MKEEFNYENKLESVGESLLVGAECVGIVAKNVYVAMKPLVEYRVRDVLARKDRSAWLKDRLESI